MNIQSTNSIPTRRGYTLLELTMVIVLGLATASAMMALMQQEISFNQISRAQNFLIEEAPQVNNAVSKMIGHADAFRIHDNFGTALAGTGAVTNGGSILVLGFTNPQTGERDFGIISFENIGGDDQLVYYNYNQFSSPPTQGDPDWIISRQVENANFFVDNGVFRMTIAGPNGETITYSGTPRL